MSLQQLHKLKPLGFTPSNAKQLVDNCMTRYKLSPCGDKPSGCEDHAPLSVWAQTGAYLLIAISEIFASITSLEYAFSKAPKNMRSLITAFSLFMAAISAAIGEGFVALSEDPLLPWNYGSMAVLTGLAGCAFWWSFRELDEMEDQLNMLAGGKVGDGE